MKGRKNGCPTSIRDWVVQIQDKSQDDTWLRIYGLEKLTRKLSSTTEDGSADTDLWEEPYVTKRNVKLTLEGKKSVDAATGTRDPGQKMLDSYANRGNCDADCTIKFIDPYGMAIVADYVVTDTNSDADDTDYTVSWDLQQVGEAEQLPYVQLSSVAIKDGDAAVTTLSLTVGGTPKALSLAFNPTDASNKRYRVHVSDPDVASLTGIAENGFTVNPLAAGTATVTVTTINGAKTASVAVTVSDGD